MADAVPKRKPGGQRVNPVSHDAYVPPNPTGRPTLYKPEIAKRVARLAMMSKNNKEIAVMLGISYGCFENWIARYPDFASGIKYGRENVDADILNALANRAMGASHKETVLHVIEGKVVKTVITKNYPPDTGAAAFWLKNRQRDNWKDRVESTHVFQPGEAAAKIREALSGMDQATTTEGGNDGLD